MESADVAIYSASRALYARQGALRVLGNVFYQERQPEAAIVQCRKGNRHFESLRLHTTLSASFSDEEKHDEAGDIKRNDRDSTSNHT